MTNSISKAKAAIEAAEDTGTLLVLGDNATPAKADNYLSLLVTDENGVQYATTGADIATKLKGERLSALKAIDADDSRPDLENVKKINASEIIADFSQVKFSTDGKVIALEGPVLNAAGFKVAKGGKNYNTAYNFTILGETKADKVVKIKVAYDEISDTTTATLEK